MAAEARSNRLFSLIIAGIATLFIIAVVYLMSLLLGAVSGLEIAPQDFTRRHFLYRRLPLLHWRLTATTHPKLESCPSQIQPYLLPLKTETRWDLVSYSRATESSNSARAEILNHYVFNNQKWIHWTEQQPALAAILWPKVQDLAVRECYFAIPECFALAEKTQDATELSRQINALIQKTAGVRADYLKDRGYSAEAKECLEWGLAAGANDELQSRLNALNGFAP